MAEFCYNNSKHSAIGMSPFMASEGREHAVELPMPIAKDSAVESIQEYRERMNNMWESVNVALRQAREDMAKYANRKRTAVPDEGYNVGDMVMLSSAYYRRIDADHRAAFSTKIISKMVRKDLGFAGVVISDDLAAAAMRDLPAGERALKFVKAGGDLLIVGDPRLASAMAKALRDEADDNPEFAGQIERSATRVLAMKTDHGLARC